ncbi:MAG: hypothetical protein MJ164_03465 [Alphaproteobacteria bacterium]|nr:hypothetical protein [Alphaproteobacteria bacterium]
MDRIPFYNLLNMLFVGLVGIVCCMFIMPDDVWMNWRLVQRLVDNATLDVVLFIAISYLVGLIVNRMGSWFIEDLLKTEKNYNRLSWPINKIKFPWRKYELYVKAQQQDHALKFLTREYVLSRNMIMLFLLLALISIWYGKCVMTGVFCFLVLVFNASMRKFVFKIIKRVDGATAKS